MISRYPLTFTAFVCAGVALPAWVVAWENPAADVASMRAAVRIAPLSYVRRAAVREARGYTNRRSL